MDWYPLYNSLRIATISCVLVFFAGIFAAYYVARLPRAVKGILDVILTLPMVLPPTVVGYFILLVFGAKRPLGIFLAQYGIKFIMVRRRAGRCDCGISSHVPHSQGSLREL